jgi:phage shock protein PspC (stress-responsive transcriptional regulator)
MYEQIIIGIIAGLAYSLAGWQINSEAQKQNSTKKKKESLKLDLVKLGRSVIICGVVGGIAGYTQQDFNILLTGGLGIGITKIVSVVWDLVSVYLPKKV